MRPNLAIHPPVVVSPTPLAPPEMRFLRIALAHHRRPLPRVMLPQLGAPTVIRLLKRAARAIVTFLRRKTVAPVRRQVALPVSGPRPPPEVL